MACHLRQRLSNFFLFRHTTGINAAEQMMQRWRWRRSFFNGTNRSVSYFNNTDNVAQGRGRKRDKATTKTFRIMLLFHDIRYYGYTNWGLTM